MADILVGTGVDFVALLFWLPGKHHWGVVEKRRAKVLLVVTTTALATVISG